jgi:hypothetical protein
LCLATKLFEKFKIIKSEEIWKKITGFQNGVKNFCLKKYLLTRELVLVSGMMGGLMDGGGQT